MHPPVIVEDRSNGNKANVYHMSSLFWNKRLVGNILREHKKQFILEISSRSFNDKQGLSVGKVNAGTDCRSMPGRERNNHSN